MPIYEYECKTCGSVFELMHSISAPPPKTCETPKCKGKPRRLVSASGFILKGSGWYATDYPSESRKKGWEEESQQGKPKASTGKSDEKDTTPNIPKEKKGEVKATEKTSAKPATKVSQKNPYTGKKNNSKKPSSAKK